MLVLCDAEDPRLVVVCPALVVCVDTDVAGTVVARVVVKWLVLVVYDTDDPKLLVVCSALVVCVDTDVTGMLVV